MVDNMSEIYQAHTLEGSFKDAVDGLFQQAFVALHHLSTSLCFSMLSYVQLKRVDLRINQLTYIFDGSFKDRQRCSWRAVPAYLRL